jgi:competence ComEA-like helix-hairpin-helix protein
MRRLLSVLIFIFLIGNVFASCNETQININSASVEELDNLTGIGEVYAVRIIENRPFSSVGDLVDVDGIGEKTLEKIKLQGLACVNEDEIEIKQEDSVKEVKENTTLTNENRDIIPEKLVQNPNEKENLTPIILNSKSIKSEEDTSNLGKNLAFGGVVTFCVMFGALFFFKTRKRKNEFR